MNQLRTIRCVIDGERNLGYVTILVAAAENLAEESAVNLSGGTAGNISTRIVICFIRSSVVAAGTIAVTTTENAVDETAVDYDFDISGIGRVTAAIQRMDGVLLAGIDVNRRRVCVVFWTI